MSQQVRVRFAPSPTGPLHIGGIRTALYNYLFAKKNNGTFVLRIEDTDQTRYVANAEKYIIDALNWCNIPFDEGPRQSERKHLYKNYANELIEKGWAYYAFDTSESLDSLRKEHESEGKTFIYNWHNRAKVQNRINTETSGGENYVIRFKTPENETLQMQDEIRGNISIETNTLDDKVLFKSDGMPTYHLANIVDDHLMEISHVIRGEEWLPSLPLHYLLYKAFEWETPKFAHLPLLLKPVGKEYINEKTGDVSRGYKEDGYFADAFINMLAFLGWNPGTEQEIFSLEELIESFELKRVSKSGAKFNPDKAKWYNQQYMQQKHNAELAELFLPILESKLSVIASDKEYVTKVVSLIKERATFVSDFWDLSSFFFTAPTSFDAKAAKKQWKETTPELMKELIEEINKIKDFSSENSEKEIKSWISGKEIGFGKVMQPLRLSLVGALKGPHLFDIMAMIGKQETIKRIEFAIDTL
ncbi:UNVERIFIED_CONTAM: hypothetical protein GTU68_041930 [Idotea baltica]|nr:hypothetical protein [Idotea baltica]